MSPLHDITKDVDPSAIDRSAMVRDLRAADALSDEVARRAIDVITRHPKLKDARGLPDALAASFPMWNDQLDRMVLPLTPSRVDAMVERCKTIESPASMRRRARAIAWRRLLKLCVVPMRNGTLDWFDHLTASLAAWDELDALTALMLGLDLHQHGLHRYAVRIWRLPRGSEGRVDV